MDSETMTILQMSNECPLFVDVPENSLSSVPLAEAHLHSYGPKVKKKREKTKEQPKQTAEENGERKRKKKKCKGDVGDGAEIQEAPELETAEQGQELGQDREQAQEQETERKEKKRDKKQREEHAEHFSVPPKVEVEEKKKKRQCLEPNGVEAFEREELIPQEKKRSKKMRTSCTDQTELSIQDDITAGVEEGAKATMQEEKTTEPIPQERKRKKRRKSCTDQTELSIQDDITAGVEEGAESFKQEEISGQIQPERKKKKRKGRTSCIDQTELSIQDDITAGVEEGSESFKQEEISVQIQQERKKKKRKGRTSCIDQTELSFQGEVTADFEDGVESSKQEEISVQIQQEKKRKKGKGRSSCIDQTELSVQGEITADITDGAEASKQKRKTTEQIPQEKKRKKRTGSTSCSVQGEVAARIQGGWGPAQVFKNAPDELAQDLENWWTDWETEKLKYIDELKEFIPDIEKKPAYSFYYLVKYDLPRFREFKKEGARVKSGRYSNKELERLQKNVQDFLALTGIDCGTKLFFPARYPEEKADIIKLKNKYKFHFRMSAGICRPWHEIYHKGRKVFDCSSKGRFTEEEIHSLGKLHQLHGNNWMKLSELTGRSSYALEKRISQQSQKKGSWTQEEQQVLESALREHLVGLVEPGDQGPTIRREQLYNKLPWSAVAQKVGTRSWDQCRLKWMSVVKKKMTAGTQALAGRKSLGAKIRLIKALYALQVEDVADVNWEDLTQEMGDVPPHYVQTRFYRMKASWVPLWQSMSFGDVVDFLHERILPQLEEKLLKTEDKATGGTEEVGGQQERFLFSEIFSDLVTIGGIEEEEEEAGSGETVHF